ncbi:metallophosphoesterase [Methylorubrum extorquens]|uniref:Phosphoesterase or phosphohydrolase n=1 Tax=Methylorubrum extorquens (strain ATCC 14718 / DSM 1338 / JCM 2805 / NCIMB 9133 / AM1) TaxID=272630 RepID=C5B067_METEA|nr:metallophosphoesterase [Methylorubrum extorquens]ACS39417.1 putative phosphoesterase or phosphohydrolase [Methylorubrum extorquens AM1]MCP1542477.1 calcineurin-like phosphoesterase family protein [Methylorubrum extorquens]MCP1590178.1 calcineurin-like phosphoesterase family protein [Methylorubrum extorquens]
MTTYLTSDSHFGHSGMMSDRMARPRPFASREEHDEALVGLWNNRVRRDDTVIHLGDFAYGCSLSHAQAVFSRLNGRKYLIRGNHEQRGERLDWDGPIRDVARVSVQDSGMRRPVDLWLSHFAHVTWPDAHRGRIHLFGHSHGSIPPTARSCDVGVDAWRFRPVTVPEIQELLADVARREGGPAAAAALAEAA